MGEQKEGIAEWLGKRGTYFYVLIMLVIFPLFYTDGLFNLCSDKEDLFLFATLIYVCVLIPVFIKQVYNLRKERAKCKGMDIVFGVILLSALFLSTIFAIDSRQSFFYSIDRMISGMCVLGCIVVFFAIRQYGIFDGVILWGWLLGSSLIYLIGILCACGINVMHIQDGIIDTQKPIYLTTLGHADLNTCYVCLMLPLIMVMYMICKEKFSQILHGINLYLGFLFIYFIKTDSVLIAMAAGLVVLLYFAVEREVWFGRYLQVIGLYLGAKATIWLLLHMYGERLHSFFDLGEILLRGNLILGEVIIYVLIIVINNLKKDCLRKGLFIIREYVLCLGIVLAICFVIGVIFANLNKVNISEDSLWSYLVVKDTTFNRRGFIWNRTVYTFINEPFWRKLFGNGLNCFREFIAAGGTVSLEELTFNDPHNEFLQMLSDMGILGVIGYFGLLLSTLIRALKTWKKNELQVAVALTLCVYLIQGIANEYSIFYLPLLCIFLGLANGSMTKNQNNEVENS